MKKTTLTTYIVLAALLVAVPGVFAQDAMLDVSTQTAAEVEAGEPAVETQVTSETSAEVSADDEPIQDQARPADEETSAAVEGDAIIEVDLPTDNPLGNIAETEVMVEVPEVMPLGVDGETVVGDTDESVESTMTIETTNFTVSAGASTESSITSAAQVQSSDDTQAYAEYVVNMHESVNKVSVKNNDTVTVTHNQMAKLFGFINVNLKAKTTVAVNQDGAVMVKTSTPWWGFLASKDIGIDANIKGDLEQTIDTQAGLSVQSQAYVIEKVAAEASAWYQSQVQAQAEAKTQAAVDAGEEL